MFRRNLLPPSQDKIIFYTEEDSTSKKTNLLATAWEPKITTFKIKF
jgi:hypothetical protein